MGSARIAPRSSASRFVGCGPLLLSDGCFLPLLLVVVVVAFLCRIRYEFFGAAGCLLAGVMLLTVGAWFVRPGMAHAFDMSKYRPFVNISFFVFRHYFVLRFL